MIFAVIDTNVVVSGLLTGRDDAPTARVLDGMILGQFPFLLSVDLLAEYHEVLVRPKIRSVHGLSETELHEILTTIAANAIVREPVSGVFACPDPNDSHLWALLRCQPGSVLVTGDQALIDQPPSETSVLSPLTFLTSSPA